MESRVNSSDNDENRSIKERLDQLASDIKKLPPDRLEQVENLLHSFERRGAVSIKEASKILGTSVDTVRRAIRSGKLKAFRVTSRGNYRISILEIERFMQGK